MTPKQAQGALFFCIGLLLCAAPGPAWAYTVYLRSQAPVKSSDVRLRDIARVEGEVKAGAISEKLVIRSLRSPMFLSREALTKALANGPEKLDWVYGSGVWIVPVSRTATGAELLEMLRQEIAKRPGGAAFLETAVFETDRETTYAIPPSGDLQFQLPQRLEHLRPGRRLMIVGVRGTHGGRETTVHRLHFGFTLLRRTRVPVATRALHPGSRLAPGDWEYRTMELDALPARPLTGDLSGRRVTGAAEPGTVLTDSILRELPAVRAGQKVELIYQSGSVVLKCESVAEGTGEVGATLAFRPLLPSGRRGRSVQARVVGDGLAQVTPEGGPR